MKKIRDGMYGYVYMTDVEGLLSKHPLVLRLHYIHQNSFTYLTYPSNHNTRYPHSLGVMHLAGEIFLNAFRNSAIEKQAALATEIGNIISRVMPSLSQPLIDIIPDEPLYRSISTMATKNYGPTSVVAYQALRIAALVHDIGHPPFSHVVEYALQDALSNYNGHEAVGLQLYDLIKREIMDDLRRSSSMQFDENTKEFFDVCLSVARVFLTANTGDRAYGLKRTICSGELDADRLDYVRRDILSAGMATVVYDLGRLLDSAFLRTNNADRYLEVGFTTGCLSTLESFFWSRFYLYRWMIYHHDVVRRNMAIQRFLIILLNYSGPIAEISHLKSKLASLAQDENERSDYAMFTDGYLISILWDVFNNVRGRLSTATTEEKEMHLFADLILNRRNDRFRSLWKRPNEYASFCKLTLSQIGQHAGGGAIEEFNRLIANVFKKRYPSAGSGLNRLKFAVEIEKKVNGELRKTHPNHRLYIYYFTGFRPVPDKDFYLSAAIGSPDAVAVDDVSPSLEGLRSAWNRAPQMMMFYQVTDDIVDDDPATLKDTYEKAASAAISRTFLPDDP